MKSMQCKKEQTDKIISKIQKNCKNGENGYKKETKEQIKIKDLDDEIQEKIVFDEEFDEDE